MRIDGKALALKIKKELKEKIKKSGVIHELHVVLVGKNESSKRFVEVKKKFANDIGVKMNVHSFEDDISAEEIKNKIAELNSDADCTGIVIQLPLPKHLPVERILNSVSYEKDVDVLGKDGLARFAKDVNFPRVPAVIGAIQEIFTEYKIEKRNKKIVILGYGRLVGEPAALWLKRENIPYEVVDEKTLHADKITKEADIIISGTGVPHMILPENIKAGVTIIDAGTSQKNAKLVGDAHPDCIAKAAFITPVPGGVGPITVAILFKNLISSHGDDLDFVK